MMVGWAVKIKCCMVSRDCWQAVRVGEEALPMQNRYLARGMWPVLSWVIMLANFLGKEEMGLA